MTQLELIKALHADLEKYGVRQVSFECDDYYYNGIIKNVYSDSDEETCVLSVQNKTVANKVEWYNSNNDSLKEIALHFSKYFGMLITEAKYGDRVDFEIIKNKY